MSHKLTTGVIVSGKLAFVFVRVCVCVCARARTCAKVRTDYVSLTTFHQKLQVVLTHKLNTKFLKISIIRLLLPIK